jgi:hypothetical protein
MCPGQCPQRKGQGLGLVRPPGLRHQSLGGRAEPVRVGRHVIMGPPCAYHQIAWLLCPSQEVTLPLAGSGRHMVTTLIVM